MNTLKSKNMLQTLFEQKQKDILTIYFTAGFPKLNDTPKILNGLEAAGVDIIEIGIPYSDPLADGPVIQNSSTHALSNGMTLAKLFEQLEHVTIEAPIVLMGYLNPVLQFGITKFIERCVEVGVSGLILPDLPVEIYERDYKKQFEAANLNFIGLVTPQSSDARIAKIDRASSGFIYAVSSASTTGSHKSAVNFKDYLDKLQNLNLKNPVLTGFNIKDHNSYQNACKHCRGAIIGSAFISHLQTHGVSNGSIQNFVQKIKQSPS
ncbi:tryptophan synthase subunit alpha [Owenweeksia hongkongensis]|uniref:tryptophan synthase subunit alpha n=1 Tax=Owenweeksia hongkongensis TaxID=253245 RepID=UPI003A8D1F35